MAGEFWLYIKIMCSLYFKFVASLTKNEKVDNFYLKYIVHSSSCYYINKKILHKGNWMIILEYSFVLLS